MILLCSDCEVAWCAGDLNNRRPRCWLCHQPGYPTTLRLYEGVVHPVKPLPPLPGDTEDVTFS